MAAKETAPAPMQSILGPRLEKHWTIYQPILKLLWKSYISSPPMMYISVFPLLLIFSSFFGAFTTWLMLLAVVFWHYSRGSAQRKADLYQHLAIRDVEGSDAIQGVSALVELFWQTKLQDIVNGQVAALEGRLNNSLPSFLMSISITDVRMGTKGPIVESVTRVSRSSGCLEIEMNALFGGDAEAVIVPMLSNAIKIPFSIRNIFAKGKVRLEIQMTKDTTSFAFSTAGELTVDFALCPLNSSLDLTNLPGFADWIRWSIREAVTKYLSPPNKVVIWQTQPQTQQPQSTAMSVPPASPAALQRQSNSPRVSALQVAPTLAASAPSVASPQQHQRRTSNSSDNSQSVSITTGSETTVGRNLGSSSWLASSQSSKPAALQMHKRSGSEVSAKDEALALFGITPTVKEFVENLCQNEEIFVNFPMDDVGPRPFELNLRQQRHAMAVMREVPKLAELRFRLCPRYLDDDKFWYVYFALLRKPMGRVLGVGDDPRSVEHDWEKLESCVKSESRAKAAETHFKIQQLNMMNL